MDWADLSRPDYKAYFDWVGQEYARRFPGGSFRLEVVPFADYPTKFTVMAVAGTVPDAMATSNAWMGDFWALGGLAPLDDRLKKQPEVQYSKFVPAAAFYGISQGGRLYNKDYTELEVNNELGARVFEIILLLLNGKRVSKGPGGRLTNLFLAGEAAMVQAGNWQVSELRRKAPQLQFDMMAYPRHPRSGKYATATWVNMVTLPKAASKPDQAREFVTWYAALEGALQRLEFLNLYSPRLDFFETAEWKARVKETPQLQRTQDVATVGGERPGLRFDQFDQFDQMEEAMKPIFNQVMKGEIAPKAAVAQLEHVTKPLQSGLPPEAR